MRKFSVTVNGTAYEVEVEEIAAGQSAAPVAAPAAPVAPKAAPAAPKAAPAAPKAAAPAGSTKISAPMPGTILSINVNAGQKAKKGDTLAILEAMKMENEILAPEDCTVVSVNVTKGQSVNTGDLIVTIQ